LGTKDQYGSSSLKVKPYLKTNVQQCKRLGLTQCAFFTDAEVISSLIIAELEPELATYWYETALFLRFNFPIITTSFKCPLDYKFEYSADCVGGEQGADIKATIIA
jgi:hypothetical protein